MVTLQEFVRETLREIVQGIKEAQALPEIGGQIAPDQIGGMKFPPDSGVVYEALILATTVKFDVAVTAEIEEGRRGWRRASDRCVLRKAEGKLGATDLTHHRIAFAVPIVFPKDSGPGTSEGKPRSWPRRAATALPRYPGSPPAPRELPPAFIAWRREPRYPFMR